MTRNLVWVLGVSVIRCWQITWSTWKNTRYWWSSWPYVIFKESSYLITYKYTLSKYLRCQEAKRSCCCYLVSQLRWMEVKSETLQNLTNITVLYKWKHAYTSESALLFAFYDAFSYIFYRVLTIEEGGLPSVPIFWGEVKDEARIRSLFT